MGWRIAQTILLSQIDKRVFKWRRAPRSFRGNADVGERAHRPAKTELSVEFCAFFPPPDQFLLGQLRFEGVSLVTFFAPAKKVTRWPQDSGSSGSLLEEQAKEPKKELESRFRGNDEQRARATAEGSAKVKSR